MKETLEEAAESRYGTDMDSIRGSKIYDLNADVKRGFVAGAKWRQEQQDDFIVGFLEFIEGTYSYSNIFDHWYLHSNTSKAYTKKELLKVYRKFKKKQHE